MPSVPKYELNADMIRDVTQKTVQETIRIEAGGSSGCLVEGLEADTIVDARACLRSLQ